MPFDLKALPNVATNLCSAVFCLRPIRPQPRKNSRRWNTDQTQIGVGGGVTTPPQEQRLLPKSMLDFCESQVRETLRFFLKSLRFQFALDWFA